MTAGGRLCFSYSGAAKPGGGAKERSAEPIGGQQWPGCGSAAAVVDVTAEEISGADCQNSTIRADIHEIRENCWW